MSSEGIPLEVFISRFKELDVVPDWLDFIDEAIRSGWKPGPLRTKISSCVGDVYGPEHRDEVLKRFDLHINNTRA